MLKGWGAYSWIHCLPLTLADDSTEFADKLVQTSCSLEDIQDLLIWASQLWEKCLLLRVHLVNNLSNYSLAQRHLNHILILEIASS